MTERSVMPSWKSVCAATALGLLYVCGASTFVDPDIWHSMSLAREAVRLGAVPTRDVFAYTPTISPVVHHEWAWGLLLYGATSGGLAALQALRVFLFAVIAVGAVSVARMRGATAASFVVVLPAIVMSWIGLTAVRAQVATLAFFTLWLGFVEVDRRGGRWWIGPAIVAYVVWLNVHAGFVVGLGVLALHTIEQAVRRERIGHLALLLVALAALVVVNPYGLAYPRYLAVALPMDRTQIGEWAPIWRARPLALATYVVSLAIAAWALARAGVGQARGWPLLAATAYLALRHERHVSLYAIVWFTQVPGYVARTDLGRTLERMWRRPASWASVGLGAYLVVAAVAMVVVRRPWQLSVPTRPGSGLRDPYPVGAVEYLAKSDFRGNLMTPFTVGAFVTWKLAPKVKVSLDGRYEAAYPVRLLSEEADFYDARPGWPAMLDRYPTDVVLARRAARIVAVLPTQTAWRLVYQDDEYVLFSRPNLDLPLSDRRGITSLGTYP
jgi:hypothetical protein